MNMFEKCGLLRAKNQKISLCLRTAYINYTIITLYRRQSYLYVSVCLSVCLWGGLLKGCRWIDVKFWTEV